MAYYGFQPDQVKAQIRSTRGETIDLALPMDCTVGDLRTFLIEEYQYHNSTKLLYNGLPVDDESFVNDYPYGSLLIATPSDMATTWQRTATPGGPAQTFKNVPVQQAPPRSKDAFSANTVPPAGATRSGRSALPPHNTSVPPSPSKPLNRSGGGATAATNSARGANAVPQQPAPATTSTTATSSSQPKPEVSKPMTSKSKPTVVQQQQAAPPQPTPPPPPPQPPQQPPAAAVVDPTPSTRKTPGPESSLKQPEPSNNNNNGIDASSAQRTPRGAPPLRGESAASRDSRTSPSKASAKQQPQPQQQSRPQSQAPQEDDVAPWQRTEFIVSCHIPALSKVVPLTISGDASVVDIAQSVRAAVPQIDADAKLVYRGKVLAQTAENKLFNLGIRGDCAVYVASGEYANADTIVLLEIEEEIETVANAMKGDITDLERKGYYENLMRILFRTDGLQELEGVWRQRRKDTVKRITKLQDELGVAA